jgi:FkbM family methyltransferase
MRIDPSEFSRKFHVPPGLVVHAGASLCQERDVYKNSGFEPVIWIEALEDIVNASELILENYPNQQIHCTTLWEESGQIRPFFRASNQGESSSLLKMKFHSVVHPAVTESETTVKPTTTLDDFLQQIGSGSDVSLLVIDLQGVELNVLRGAKITLQRTNAILCEVSTVEMYKGQSIFRDVHGFLVSCGFSLVQHDIETGSVMGDGLYVKTEIATHSNLISLEPPILGINRSLLLGWLRLRLLNAGIPSKYLRNPLRILRRIFKGEVRR